MTDITYEQALAVVAEKEKSVLTKMQETFADLKAELEHTSITVGEYIKEVPQGPGVPSNINAILNQYDGQIKSWLDQVGYMLSTSEGMLAVHTA